MASSKIFAPEQMASSFFIDPPLSQGVIATPPSYEQKLQTQEVHGVVLTDPYAYLRADNWQDVLRTPEILPTDIRTKIDQENIYADALFAPLAPLQKTLRKELKARLVEDDEDPPLPDGDFAYFTKYRIGGQYDLLYRQPWDGKVGGGEAVLLLDGDLEAKGKDFFDLGDCAHSPCHKKLAWSSDSKGSEYYTIRVRDIDASLKAGKAVELDDVLTDTEGSVVWLKDSSGFFYVWLNSAHRPEKVFLHRLGTKQSDDVLIYQEEDPGWFLDITALGNGDYGVIDLHDHDSCEAWLLDLRAPLTPPKLITPRQRGLRYDVDVRGDLLFILTNANEAVDFKIVTAPLDNPGLAQWQDFIPHRAGSYVEDFSLYANHLVLAERHNALVQIIIHDLASGVHHAIAHDEEAYALGIEEGLEFDTTTLRYSVSSPARPAQTFDYDMVTRQKTLLKTQEIPSGHNADDYIVRRVEAVSYDGEKIPVTLLYHRDTKLGDAPVLLYGYGAYGYALNASFATNRFSLVNRGFIHALAHIRGGTDKGFGWYQAGKLQFKANSFLDFIAAGEMLIDEGFTKRGRIVAHGGSAGGMLMGAVANMAPYLFAGIVADVPFVDVLNTMLDDTLPLTPPEWLEWGNPIESADDFARIKSYSPYDNVSVQTYPPIFAIAGLTDPRVTYWEPLKWVAKLREKKAKGSGVVMLKTNTAVGHGGASGRYDQLEEVAMIQAFALGCVGMAG